MSKKTKELRTQVPIQACYELLIKIGKEIKWKSVETDNENFKLKWKQDVSTTVTAVLEPIANETYVSFTVDRFGGLVDPFGLLDTVLQKMMSPFQLATEVEGRIREGLLCPTCGKEIPAGTKFCPNDGTQVAFECPKCKKVNPLGTHFCTNCGASLL